MSMLPFGQRRTLRRIYILVTLSYLLLGVALAAPALATQQHIINPVAPIPNGSSAVPTGNDDATVQQYYDYLALQHLGVMDEQYNYDWQNFLVVYLEIAAFIIVFYVFILSWYARHRELDLYPVEVYNGVITERSGPVDPLSWGVFAILGIYMVYYIVIQLIYGQLY